MKPTRRIRKTWALLLAAGLLAATFLAYLAPGLAFDLATRVWGCF